MTKKEIEFQIAGVQLKGQYYEPKETKAVVILVHGLGEYSRRYERNVVPFLVKNSITILSYDLFGHGFSQGKRGHHPGYNYIMDSVDLMISKARSLFKGKPIFLYGHSMGGNVVINYCLRRSNLPTGLIATSPFLGLAFRPPKWKVLIGKIFDKLLPSLTMPNELDLNALSRDSLEVNAYKNDHLIHDRVSTGYSLRFMETGEWAVQNAHQLEIPLLLLHGTADKITSHKSSVEFARRSESKSELVLIEDAYHELHHDLDKEKVFEIVASWIDNKIQTIK